jgi:hypothetical protein
MKPSDVILFRAALPLIDTFGRAEMEFAAALMVRACIFHGDEWQPVTPRQINLAMKKDLLPGGIWASLRGSPKDTWPSPDLRALAKEGYAIFHGDPDVVPGPAIEFTVKGLAMLEEKATAAGLENLATKREMELAMKMEMAQ